MVAAPGMTSLLILLRRSSTRSLARCVIARSCAARSAPRSCHFLNLPSLSKTGSGGGGSSGKEKCSSVAPLGLV